MANTNIKALTSRLKQADAPANTGAAKKAAPAPKKEDNALEIDDIDDIDDFDNFDNFDEQALEQGQAQEPEQQAFAENNEIEDQSASNQNQQSEREQAQQSDDAPEQSEDLYDAYNSLFDQEPEKEPVPEKKLFRKPRAHATLTPDSAEETNVTESQDEQETETVQETPSADPLTAEPEQSYDDSDYMEEPTEEEECEEYDENEEYDPNHDGYYDDVKPEIDAEIDRIDKENIMKIVGIAAAFIFVTVYLVFYW